MNSDTQKTRFELTDHQQRHLKRIRQQIADELPELIDQDRRMKQAAEQESVSGALRRAAHRSGMSIPALAAQTGISPESLCDFLEGKSTLASDTLDRLAQTVGFQPTGHA